VSALAGTLQRAGLAFWTRAAAWTTVIGLAIGVPAVLIENSSFKRMTPTSLWQYIAFAVTALLVGLVLAARSLPRATCRVEGRALAGGGLAYLAVGCPICNRVVVALLGVSGALNYFAPVQPLLALLSVGVLVVTLRTVLRTACLGTSRMVPDGSAQHPRNRDLHESGA
jgi:hypothetical protein